MSTEQTPRESALNTAESLRSDLEKIAKSDLPFSEDAQNILNDIEKTDNKNKQ
jgi:hypothetical protein